MNKQTAIKKGLSVKDLVTVGIFSALFLVFALVGGIFFAPNPVLTFYMPVGSALLCGPVYLLMLAKVKKRWAVSILGAILCIVWFVTGMHWAMALGYLVMGVAADFVAGAGEYKSKMMNSVSYIVISRRNGFVSRVLRKSRRMGKNNARKRYGAVIYRHNARDGKRVDNACHACGNGARGGCQCVCGMQNAAQTV